ncbi:MAG: 30S ribosomal protein S6 [Patescibacteria group bacterium]
MRQYEMTYLISDKVPDADINKVTGKIGGFIAELEGKIAKEEIWKRRKLAYPIKKQEYATYITLNFELPGENIRELENQIKLAPEIIRHLLIVRETGNEKITLTAAEIADTAEIEKAIGGKRSFEVVEGETEESRDFQAIREKEEEEKAPELAKPETEVKKARPALETEAPTEAEPAAEKVESKSAGLKKTESSTETKPKVRRKKVAMSESDRLAKLDEELDNLLKEDL